MRNVALAIILALAGCAPAMAQVIEEDNLGLEEPSDICTNHGFHHGTLEYLECWRYVTGTAQRNERQRQHNFEASMNLFLNSVQPQQRTYACTNPWGQLMTCVQ